jgi:hypothetical protein
MQTADQATGKTLTIYEAHVLVKGNVTIDRSLCLNEPEAEQYLRSRLTEISPLPVKRVHVTHKERDGSSSIWEAEAALQGKLKMGPMPREELKSLVKDAIGKAGFDDANVDVRGLQREKTEKKDETISNKEMPGIAKKLVNARMDVHYPIKRDEILALKEGDRVQISRGGFKEWAKVVSIDAVDDTLEARRDNAYAPDWVPFAKVWQVERAQ